MFTSSSCSEIRTAYFSNLQCLALPISSCSESSLTVVLILVIAIKLQILRRISNQLSVVIDVPGEDEAYHLQPRLFGKIVPAKCRYEVLSTKVEIRLAKAEIITRASLEHGKGLTVFPKPNVLSKVSKRPAYPSSKKVKDWEKLEAEVKKQEKGEKLEGDAALNKSLREIYLNADEDMRRAMSKSFVKVESNGTVLSIDWKEVGAKTIESTRPDGMELKKWEI
ncbi:hypothetical protein HID58_001332 [Brassica napus]|uniref:SGS domain-containing protein n=1 Tax=Brassica napus TaxID=3708 RepID=A0ABQ8EM25_BRANA|nr:protein SGT1 homolog A [Brassica napus]KAH0941695.1 hypothetical protein HID58_001332 [Brassica napus]